ncbi:Pvc16 family protein [Escherichia sp. E1130]|uniref:Pvc16 family protein n=1 Tax=Escherichia sp. E1130 TaxID=2041645 RepID=UPI001436B0F6|nr:Pvc16 family protein [Escherichia sp. E1130]
MLNDTDDEIAQLNIRIEDHIRSFLQLEEGKTVDIRFDPPDSTNPPSIPTLHLFLYLIHEDLALRHGERRRYLPKEQCFSPAEACVRCLYLATYWDSESSSSGYEPAAAADNQSVRYLNRVVKALLNMRINPDFAQFTVRTIEPEALNSLGNFWQALGNKPRAIINFSVTLPVEYASRAEPVTPIFDIRSTVVQNVAYWQLLLEQQLMAQLQVLVEPGALAGIVLKVNACVSENNERRYTEKCQDIRVLVSGLLLAHVAEVVESQIADWIGMTLESSGNIYTVVDVDSQELVAILRQIQMMRSCCVRDNC